MPAHLPPEQLERALELQRKCWTHKRIADEIGVSRVTVTRSLGRVNRRALKLLEKRTAAIKAQQVDQLEWTAEEAAGAWLKSKEAAETIKTVTGETAKGEVDTTETTIKGQAGDPRFLERVRDALAEVREILGIDHRLDLARLKVVRPDTTDARSALLDEAEGMIRADERQGPDPGDPRRLP